MKKCEERFRIQKNRASLFALIYQSSEVSSNRVYCIYYALQFSSDYITSIIKYFNLLLFYFQIPALEFHPIGVLFIAFI